MTASLPETTPESRPARRSPVVGIIAAAFAWAACLAVVVARSANPVVVNRVQVWHADSIVLGAWDVKTARLTVERTWKAPLAEATIAIGKMPRTARRIIVPVTRVSPNQFEVTQGVLLNPPERRPVGGAADEPRRSEVLPLVYPATDDVIRQIEALLSSVKSLE